MDVTAWLEGSALGVWTRESPSIWAYPTILTLHTLGLGILAGANAVVDFRLLSFAPRLPVPSLVPLYRFMWFGLAVNVVTGVMLFIAEATTKARQPVFFIKLTLIALALVNTALIKTTVFRDPAIVESGTIPRQARRLALASLLLWTGAITAGRLMAYL
jgi:hypothetical protein